ncbi:MAG: rod shape-determining protein MreC [Pseudomonadota bacterium]
MAYQAPTFFRRGPSPLARLAFFSLLSLLLLFSDARFSYLDNLRQVAAVLLYPLQRLAGAPGAVIEDVGEFFSSHARLESENTRLKQQNLDNAAALLRLQTLVAENAHLRQLLELHPRFEAPGIAAEIMYEARDPFTRRVVIDKGSQHGIKPGQPVMDEIGVIGQVTRVFAWAAEVRLLTDKDHVTPVQVVRNGLRAVVFGIGEEGTLDMRYMPNNADIQEGDVLVTSGIDGVYPSGLPIATVTRIEHDPAYAFARIHCTPRTGVSNYAHVMVLGERKLPENPALEVEVAPVKHKKPRKGSP